jgi:sulfur carrier protein
VIRLNGQESELQPGETVAAVLRRLELSPEARGIAVAVDGEVVPRAGWETYVLSDEARIEVLTAIQGG